MLKQPLSTAALRCIVVVTVLALLVVMLAGRARLELAIVVGIVWENAARLLATLLRSPRRR